MSKYLVAKFGGSSMAQPELVAKIVQEHPEYRRIIVSAPGTSPDDTEKMTDTLIRYAKIAPKSAVRRRLAKEILARMDRLYKSLGDSDRRDLRETVKRQLNPEQFVGPMSPAYYASLGERFSAEYFGKLTGIPVADASAIRFDLDGRLNRSKTAEMIRTQAKSSPGQLIVPGFYGRDDLHHIHLLGRGGSDRTGALYAAALGWDYVNWTDVDGVYSADPRIVSGARILPEVTREEVREGAHGGSGILQGNTIVDLVDGAAITTIIRNTFNLDAPGTRVLPALQEKREQAIVAVSGRDDLLGINIRDLGMAERKGYGAQILGRLSELGLAFEHLPAAQDSFSITLRDQDDRQAIDQFTAFARQHRLSRQGTVSLQPHGVVYVVGEGLREPQAKQRTILRALEVAESLATPVTPIVNPEAPSIAFLVDRSAVADLVRAIHRQEIERLTPGETR